MFDYCNYYKYPTDIVLEMMDGEIECDYNCEKCNKHIKRVALKIGKYDIDIKIKLNDKIKNI